MCQKDAYLAGGQTIYTEGPQAAGGKGDFMTTTDYLASALASCTRTIMTLKAEAKGVDFVRCYAEGGNKVSMEDFRVTRTNIVFHLNAAFEAELLRSELPR